MSGPTSSNLSVDAYAADVNLTAGQDYTTPGVAIPVAGVKSVLLFPKSTGADALSSGQVTFYVAYSYDGETFTTEADTITLTLNTNSAVRAKPIAIDVDGCRAIKIVRMVNGDATYAANSTNVRVVSQG